MSSETQIIPYRRTDYDAPNDIPADFSSTTMETERQVAGILFDEDTIKQRIQKLAKEIYNDYKDNKEKPIFISIEYGARPFTHDILQELEKLDSSFVLKENITKARFQSYIGTKSGTLKMHYTPSSEKIENRDIIIIEDIVDTGETMKAYQSKLIAQKVKSAVVCTLLNKPSQNNFESKYIGFNIEDKFVIGYGMDYNGQYRDLTYIGVYNQDL